MGIHACARTTPALRREIQASSLSERAMAKKYNVTRTTIQKWKRRDSVEDRSHRGRPYTSLNAAQEQIVITVRKTLLLSLDDLVGLTREFLHEKASRASIHRCLKRHGLSNLKRMEQQQTTTQSPTKPHPDVEPGTVYIDLKHLPHIADESSRRYLLVAIDRATRWVYLELGKNKSATHTRAFLQRLIAKAPFRIVKILTDDGSGFSNHLRGDGESNPTAQHPFGKACAKHNITHCLIKPRMPATNDKLEQFNGRYSEVLSTSRFDPSQDLKTTLARYLYTYNQQLPQQTLGHRSPIEVLAEWATNRPDLFKVPSKTLKGMEGLKEGLTSPKPG